MFDDDYGYAQDSQPFVSAAERRRQAERELAALQKKGQTASPVVIGNSKIATTFWGRSWCESLERHSDYSIRLPRGRAYVRSGAVVDLQIEAGEVKARVSGSSLYKISVRIKPLPKAQWQAICRDCSGGIGSMAELLKGRFSPAAMQRICQKGTGIFPAPREISLECSCPDRDSMCKHLAAVLYGIGARLDASPELLFRLRQVDASELVASAGAATPPAAGLPGGVDGHKPAGSTPAGAAGDAQPAASLRPKESSPERKEAAPARRPSAKPGSKARQTEAAKPSKVEGRKKVAAPKRAGPAKASRPPKASGKAPRRGA